MYHGVVADDEALAEGNWLQLRASDFRAQLAYLKEHYDVIRIDQAFSAPAGAPTRPRAIITFDDGYANNYTVAFPLLREFGFPATVFLATAFVDTQKLFWWDRLHLGCLSGPAPDPQQVRELKRRSPRDINAAVDAFLAARGGEAPTVAPEAYRVLRRDEIARMQGSGLIEFGSHTHGHEILDTLADEEIVATLEVSAEKLQKMGIAARHFAAPNGDYADAHAALIEAAGYADCFSTEQALWAAPAKPYHIPRLDVGRDCGIDHFALLISGLLQRRRPAPRPAATDDTAAAS